MTTSRKMLSMYLIWCDEKVHGIFVTVRYFASV